MKRLILVLAVCAVVALLTLSIVFAKAKTYQFTGTVQEVTDNSIVVEKGKEKFEMSKDEKTRVKGDLKVGSKVTVKYESRAVDIEVRPK